MKKLILLFIACFSLAFIQPLTSISLRFYWDQSTNELDTNLFWNIYQSSDLTINQSNWPIYTNIAYTNLVATNADYPTNSRFFLPFTTTIQQQFFFMTSSNALTGYESPPTPVVATPPIARSPAIRLTK